MRQFEWRGKTYTYDSQHCYNNTSLIRLPEGGVLGVTGWLEVLPPRACGFTPVDILPGMEPEAITHAVETTPQNE